MAQSGSARGLGPRGRRFKSCLPDQVFMTHRTRLFLVRHGESELNSKGIITGQLDPPLTVEGRRQAFDTKTKLSDVKFDAVYSSDLKRAIETGEIISGASIPRANKLSSLRERTFGSLEGMSEELQKPGTEHKSAVPHEKAWHYRNVPDMESDYDLNERFMTGLKAIADANEGKVILVAAHGGPIRTVLMNLKKLTNKNLPAGSFRNAGYVELEYDGRNFAVVHIVGANIF